jgi:hypothetical protein
MCNAQQQAPQSLMHGVNTMPLEHTTAMGKHKFHLDGLDTQHMASKIHTSPVSIKNHVSSGA